MAESNFNRFYPREDLASLVGPVPVELLRAWLVSITLDVPFADIELTATHGVVVRWQDIPSASDIAAIDAAIASFVGGTTSRAPLVAEALGVTSATVENEPVTVIDETTPPREAGTYLINAVAMVGMLAVVANTGVRGSIVLELIRGENVVASRAYTHGSREQEPQTFGAPLTFECEAGDRVRAHVTVTKLGAAAATARMAGVRVSIVQLSPA